MAVRWMCFMNFFTLLLGIFEVFDTGKWGHVAMTARFKREGLFVGPTILV